MSAKAAKHISFNSIFRTKFSIFEMINKFIPLTRTSFEGRVRLCVGDVRQSWQELPEDWKERSAKSIDSKSFSMKSYSEGFWLEIEVVFERWQNQSYSRLFFQQHHQIPFDRLPGIKNVFERSESHFDGIFQLHRETLK